MRSKRILLIAAAVLVVLLAGLWASGKALSPWAQAKFIAALENRFASKVEIGSLDLQLFPRFSAVGEKMVFRHKGRSDVPPLFEIERFSASSSLPSFGVHADQLSHPRGPAGHRGA